MNFLCAAGKDEGQDGQASNPKGMHGEFGIHVHSLIDVRDVHEYLQSQEQYKDILPLMESYMDKYCVF